MAAGGSAGFKKQFKQEYRLDITVFIVDVPARILPTDVTVSLSRGSKNACTSVMHLTPESKGRSQGSVSLISSLRSLESGGFDPKIYKARVNQVCTKR